MIKWRLTISEEISKMKMGSADAYLSETLLAGYQDYKSLSLEQRQRFNAYVIGILNTYDDIYLQHLNGFVESDQWEIAVNFFSEFFGNENMRNWWKKRGASVVSSRFRQEVDRMILGK